MNLSQYLENKKNVATEKVRILCVTCLQPQATCYCAQIRKFDPGIEFIILIHPIEVRRRIATGRMSHLCLENSQLIMGHDYTDDPRVNAILNDSSVHPLILYPGKGSTNLTDLSTEQRGSFLSNGKRLAVFVIDGTWASARKMVRLSRNLHGIQRICFTPPGPSNFRVRKQPAPHCYSTLEAIHHTIELLGPARGFDPSLGQHNALLRVFDHMVEQQLEYIRLTHRVRTRSRHNG